MISITQCCWILCEYCSFSYHFRRDQYPSKPERGIIGTGKEGNQPGEFNQPFGVCYDEKNHRILVTDGINGRIQLFDRKGQFLSTFGYKRDQDGEFGVNN